MPLSRGLSTKLLLLTVAFVLLAEVLIFLPSVANFRLQWLEQRLATAAAVSVVLMQAEPVALPRAAQDDVLMAIGVKAIAVREGGVSRLMVVSGMPPKVDEHVDLATAPMLEGDDAARSTPCSSAATACIRVFGKVGDSDKEFELIMPDTQLRNGNARYIPATSRCCRC